MNVLSFERPIVELEEQIASLERLAEDNPSLVPRVSALREELERTREAVFSNLTPFQVVQLARHPDRPPPSFYVDTLFSEVFPLSGDRLFAEDRAVLAGIGVLKGGRRVCFAAHEKGRNTQERIDRRFGMPNPEGYRKVLRVLALAEKFDLPVVTFVDTAGAYPGVEAETRGQFSAIAHCIAAFLKTPVPTTGFVTGEGGSGGALAIAATDRLYALSYATYSVISPEGASSILYKSADEAERVARELKLTAADCLRFGVVDGVIDEPVGGAHRDAAVVAERIGETLERALAELESMSASERLAARKARFEAMGEFAGSG